MTVTTKHHVTAAAAFIRLLLGHLRWLRSPELQDLATDTLRNPEGHGSWVVPALNVTIQLRQSITGAVYLHPRRIATRTAFRMRSHNQRPAAAQRGFSILCPTRERPARVNTLMKSISDTAHAGERVEVLCYVDDDDPALPEYRRLFDGSADRWPSIGRARLLVGEPVGVPGAWNTLAAAATGDYLLMGNDDQLYVDYGWDDALDRRLDQLTARHPDEILCLYFDAGQYRDGGCDFPIISRAWYETLGYYSLQRFQQWQIERWIFDIASRVGRRYPVPGILVEHLHYQDYKAPFDSTYQRHRMTRAKSLADHALFVRTAGERRAAAERLRAAIDSTTSHPAKRCSVAASTAPASSADTGQYILQAARRYYGTLIDAWHYAGRTEDARACAELAVAQGIWFHPMQRPREHVPGLRAQPIHEPNQFWFVPYLQERYPQIRAEIEAVLDSAQDPVRPTVDDGALIRRGEWRQAHLFRDGRWQDDICARFPVTQSILAAIPEVTTFSPGVITVSRVAPGSHIMPHCGPTNAVLRIHLPIRIPAGVSIRVADQWLTWQEGRAMVFDDSFEHEVRHDGTTDRVVLILDILHPDLGGDHADRLRQRRLTTEEQIVAFMREGGFERVFLDDGQIVLHPEPAMRDLVERYMNATGIVSASLSGDKIDWHAGDTR